MDGLSLLLVLLTSIVVPFALLAQPMSRGFCALVLFTQAALYGTFTAQNFILWFLFYEMSLIPSFLLIKLWGGANRDRAATKFFVYTFLGSVAMLLAFLGIYFARGTFDFATLAQMGKTGLFRGNGIWFAFFGIFLGLAVKVPLFPFHTWLPDAYENAPTGASMILTGLLSKMGVYGFIRLLLPLFPNELRIVGPWLLGLAVCSIVFASLAAWAQRDLKRMVAYLSINHLGYCMLGLFAISTRQPLGRQPKRRPRSAASSCKSSATASPPRRFSILSGCSSNAAACAASAISAGSCSGRRLLCGWMSVAMFSSLGLPGLNGFVGEFLIFKGSFALAPVFTAVAVLGLLFTAIVFLRAMQALFSGQLAEGCRNLPDLTRGELIVIVPVSALMLALGLAPQFLLHLFNATVAQMARLFN